MPEKQLQQSPIDQVPIEELARRLEGQAQTISACSDQLRAYITQLDERLAETFKTTGVSYWESDTPTTEVLYPPDTEEVVASHYLAVWKHEGRWGLAIALERHDKPFPGPSFQCWLREANREDMIKAAMLLPQFLANYSEKVAAVVHELHEAANAVQPLLNGITR